MPQNSIGQRFYNKSMQTSLENRKKPSFDRVCPSSQEEEVRPIRADLSNFKYPKFDSAIRLLHKN